jgi:hypothetical protein
MNTSPEDARLILDRWHDQCSPLRIQLRHDQLMFEGRGTVTHVSTEALALGSDMWRFTVPFEGSSFVFSDPREIPIASLREKESARYEFGLAVLLPSGDRLVLVQFKEEVEEER